MGVGFSKIDRKGRVLIPRVFREVFPPGTNVVIEMTPEGELIVRKAEDAEEIINKIKSIKLRGDKKKIKANAEEGKHMYWG
ncbi:MAG: MraZ N-terminal domain-containing protein [Candidatus Njordarchaeales archaeon]